jgi:hypothetical protein
MRASCCFLAVFAAATGGIAGAVSGCGFDGEGLRAVSSDGGSAGEASLPGTGTDGGPIAAEGGVDVDGAPVETDGGGPCTLGDGGAGTLCAGKCVDTARSNENCGGCGITCSNISACEGACVFVATALDGFRYEIVCQDTGSPYCNGGSPPPPAKTVMLSGTAGKSYVIGIRVRGVLEQNSYSGTTAGGATGTSASFFVFGGNVTNNNWNTYSLAVSSPAKTAFLNSGAAGHDYVDGIDYTAKIDADAFAQLTLASASSDNLIAKNRDQTNAPIVVAGVPPAPAAYNGQFVQIDVQSVALAP